MYISIKGLLIVMTISTIIWTFVGVFYYIDLLDINRHVIINMPYWFVHLILIIGYIISVGIGFAVFYEKKLWRID
jgi:hypothetical protein